MNDEALQIRDGVVKTIGEWKALEVEPVEVEAPIVEEIIEEEPIEVKPIIENEKKKKKK